MRLVASDNYCPYIIVHTERILQHKWLYFSLLEQSAMLGQAGLKAIKTTTASWLYVAPDEQLASEVAIAKLKLRNFHPRKIWSQANITEMDNFNAGNAKNLHAAMMIPKSELSGRYWLAFEALFPG
jgi:hypothetical protein